MYVCMCACMYVCVHVCMYVYMCANVCLYISMYVCMYACVDVSMCVCMYVCVYVFLYRCMFVFKYVCMLGEEIKVKRRGRSEQCTPPSPLAPSLHTMVGPSLFAPNLNNQGSWHTRRNRYINSRTPAPAGTNQH